ncbi:MAG TPA: helix-turn-helix domain-containing protein [Puia sp.]|nr:helix-turn-helix domain-containing protein [Puia sp.]
MSSNIRLKRICEFCGNVYVAKTSKTRFCSHDCNQKAYKQNQKQSKIDVSNEKTKKILTGQKEQDFKSTIKNTAIDREIITVDELSAFTCLSRRTLYKLMEDKNFPKLKIGKRVLFIKKDIMEYLTTKFKIV